jgi:Rrf2 family nitric oxide-sensitive transcriptional repressor
MRLSRHSEVALRTLVYLAAQPGRLTSIGEIARSLDVSHNHLMKIVPSLRRGGFVEAVRGPGGGIRLARDHRDMRMSEVIRFTERSSIVLGASSSEDAQISNAVKAATDAFMIALDGYTLADLGPSEVLTPQSPM